VTLGVLNALINRPEGMSNVRMMESRDAATSQRESGEKAYPVPLSQRSELEPKGKPRTTSSIRPRNPFSSLTTLRVSMSTIRTTRSSQITASRLLSRCSRIDVAADGSTKASSSWVVWKSKNWEEGQRVLTRNNRTTLTLMVPSSVLAITRRFKASVAKPVTPRYSVCFFDADRVLNRLETPGGQGPMSNFFRFSPDCMFHMFISPVDVVAKQKFPHAETHIACQDGTPPIRQGAVVWYEPDCVP